MNKDSAEILQCECGKELLNISAKNFYAEFNCCKTCYSQLEEIV